MQIVMNPIVLAQIFYLKVFVISRKSDAKQI